MADIGSVEFSVPMPVMPTITTTSLSNGEVDTDYSETLVATGDAPIAWTLESGSLPDGLTLNGVTGEISGTPTLSGIFSFMVKAWNSVGSDTKQLGITIDPAPVTNPIYAALGDSVPAGYGLADLDTQSYPVLLSGLLNNNGVPNTMVNF